MSKYNWKYPCSLNSGGNVATDNLRDANDGRIQLILDVLPTQRVNYPDYGSNLHSIEQESKLMENLVLSAIFQFKASIASYCNRYLQLTKVEFNTLLNEIRSVAIDVKYNSKV